MVNNQVPSKIAEMREGLKMETEQDIKLVESYDDKGRLALNEKDGKEEDDYEQETVCPRV